MHIRIPLMTAPQLGLPYPLMSSTKHHFSLLSHAHHSCLTSDQINTMVLDPACALSLGHACSIFVRISDHIMFTFIASSSSDVDESMLYLKCKHSEVVN